MTIRRKIMTAVVIMAAGMLVKRVMNRKDKKNDSRY
jgi:hypothetical protein